MELPSWRPEVPLPQRTVRVIVADTEAMRSAPWLSRYERLLSEEENVRRSRFHFERDRHLYLVSHALCRVALAATGQVDTASLRFKTNEHGRPEIDYPEELRQLRFNLSHTHGMAALALVWDAAVGVDVEDCLRSGVGLDIAKAYFSHDEVEYLAKVSAETTREVFFTFWTLKESYIKARGMGLAIPLDKFSFRLDGTTPAISLDPELQDHPDGWQFETWKLSLRHALALGVRSGAGRDFSVELCRWEGKIPQDL